LKGFPAGNLRNICPVCYDFAMALTCNIDAKGKRVRLINGIIMILAAVAVAVFWARPQHSIVGWVIAGIILFCGGFSVFEAQAGWCALRAMGIKTRV
jgi:sugar phosphate permease